MNILITNTTDDKFVGSTIKFTGIIDGLSIDSDTTIELIDVIEDGSDITLVSSNYIINGIIVQE